MSPAAPVELALGSVDQIPRGEGREFVVDGLRLAVFRSRGGSVAVTQAACPHRHGPLADGILGTDTVTCPLHGWRFCLLTGQARTGDCDAIAVFDSRIGADGEIHVTVPPPGDGEALGRPPARVAAQ